MLAASSSCSRFAVCVALSPLSSSVPPAPTKNPQLLTTAILLCRTAYYPLSSVVCRVCIIYHHRRSSAANRHQEHQQSYHTSSSMKNKQNLASILILLVLLVLLLNIAIPHTALSILATPDYYHHILLK